MRIVTQAPDLMWTIHVGGRDLFIILFDKRNTPAEQYQVRHWDGTDMTLTHTCPTHYDAVNWVKSALAY